MNMKPVNIVFICDEGYVMQTSTAIASCIKNKNNNSRYNIFVICSDISDTSAKILKNMSCKNCIITIINASTDNLQGLHTYRQGGYLAATEAALLKFNIPELLPELDRVLYLDGDIIVCGDLGNLYNTDIGENYIAAAHDTGKLYFKHKYVKKYAGYFNSGVMVLNLKIWREQNLSKQLIQTKKSENDSNLMDQNIFNVVMDGHVKYLDIKYNFLCVNLPKMYVQDKRMSF